MNYLIYGSSYVLIDKEIDKIVSAKKKEIFYLDEVELKDILDDLGYNSMFDEEKVIVLKNFNALVGIKASNEENLERLYNYLEAPNPKTILIFISSEKITGKGIIKKIVGKLNVIETPIITKSYELAKLLGDVFRNSGYGAAVPVLEMFANRCALNYDVALKEFEKLKDIKGDDKLIRDTDILEHVPNYNMSDIFGFKDAFVKKDIKKASEMLFDLEMAKMEIVPLVVMLAKEYQCIYEVKLLVESGYKNDKIASELGDMHPYRVKLLREICDKYTIDELEKIILELCNIDLRLVSEDNLGFDELRKLLLAL